MDGSSGLGDLPEEGITSTIWAASGIDSQPKNGGQPTQQVEATPKDSAAISHPALSADNVSSFPRFRSLPGELQNRIWDLTIEPRRVVVHCQSFKGSDNTPPDSSSSDETTERHLSWSSSAAIPPSLQATRSSRSWLQGRGRYAKAFVSNPPTDLTPEKPTYVWVNFTIDTISLDTDALMLAPPEDVERICRLDVVPDPEVASRPQDDRHSHKMLAIGQGFMSAPHKFGALRWLRFSVDEEHLPAKLVWRWEAVKAIGYVYEKMGPVAAARLEITVAGRGGKAAVYAYSHGRKRLWRKRDWSRPRRT